MPYLARAYLALDGAIYPTVYFAVYCIVRSRMSISNVRLVGPPCFLDES